MKSRLDAVVRKVNTLSPENASILNIWLSYLKQRGTSESHQANSMQVLYLFAKYVEKPLVEVTTKREILSFLERLKDR